MNDDRKLEVITEQEFIDLPDCIKGPQPIKEGGECRYMYGNENCAHSYRFYKNNSNVCEHIKVIDGQDEIYRCMYVPWIDGLA